VDAAQPLVVPDTIVPEAAATAEAKPAAEVTELLAEPRGTPLSSPTEAAPVAPAGVPARLVLPDSLVGEPPLRAASQDSSEERPRRETRLPLVEERSTAAAAAASRPVGEVSPAAAEAPSEHEEAATPVSEEVRGPGRAPELRSLHVAEERRPRRPPASPPSAPRRAAASAAPRPPEPEVEPLPDPASLFQQKPEGRSPADWLGRIEAAAREAAAPTDAAATPGTPAPQPAAARPRPAPTPISMSARRFLRPLVGIDPDEVVIYRGAEAAQAAAARGADALARERNAVGTAGSEQEPRRCCWRTSLPMSRGTGRRFIPPGAAPDSAGAPPMAKRRWPAR
jgi:hypothetical protein